MKINSFLMLVSTIAVSSGLTAHGHNSPANRPLTFPYRGLTGPIMIPDISYTAPGPIPQIAVHEAAEYKARFCDPSRYDGKKNLSVSIINPQNPQWNLRKGVAFATIFDCTQNGFNNPVAVSYSYPTAVPTYSSSFIFQYKSSDFPDDRLCLQLYAADTSGQYNFHIEWTDLPEENLGTANPAIVNARASSMTEMIQFIQSTPPYATVENFKEQWIEVHFCPFDPTVPIPHSVLLTVEAAQSGSGFEGFQSFACTSFDTKTNGACNGATPTIWLACNTDGDSSGASFNSINCAPSSQANREDIIFSVIGYGGNLDKLNNFTYRATFR